MSDEFCLFFFSFIIIVYYISLNMLYYIQIINKSLHLDTIYMYTCFIYLLDTYQFFYESVSVLAIRGLKIKHLL